MQQEVPKEEQQRQQQQQQQQQQDPLSGRKCDVPINEGLLKVMGDLGIDINMTKEVIQGLIERIFLAWETC